MGFHTHFKMIIDLRIHHKTGNYEQVMGSYVLRRKAAYWFQEFAC